MLSLLTALASVVPAESAEEKAYTRCVMEEAEQLTPSGENAEVVSRVALLKCQRMQTAALRNFHQRRLAMLREKGVSGTISDSRRLLQQLAEDLAVYVIVETRASAAK